MNVREASGWLRKLLESERLPERQHRGTNRNAIVVPAANTFFDVDARLHAGAKNKQLVSKTTHFWIDWLVKQPPVPALTATIARHRPAPFPTSHGVASMYEGAGFG